MTVKKKALKAGEFRLVRLKVVVTEGLRVMASLTLLLENCSEATATALTDKHFERNGQHFAQQALEFSDQEKRPRNIEHYAPHSFDCLASFTLFRTIWSQNTNLLFNELFEANTPQLAAIASVSMYIDTMLESFINEMKEGRATACSSMARSIGEACDLYIAFLLNPQIASEYTKWEDGFYKFWRKCISKEKLTPYKIEIISQWADAREIVGDLADWHRDEMQFLSESTHPSFRAGMMVTFEYGNTGKNPLQTIWPPSRAARFIMMALLPVVRHQIPFKDIWSQPALESSYAQLCIKHAILACNAMRDEYAKKK